MSAEDICASCCEPRLFMRHERVRHSPWSASSVRAMPRMRCRSPALRAPHACEERDHKGLRTFSFEYYKG